ncbi:hypothetical protein FKW77_006523 [Venturia effusa]|uniref:Uncharacterized protein n=1 Tax=Venturia effusa TaxID=50376 RepID=A0A517L9I4_9PEZI|nr:hypothetical protein FKW77_006523 [Venturia effusa]
MCYIWRCDADDFGHTGPLHVYLQHITPWNRIPFIFDEAGKAHRIHHMRLNVRSSCPIICIDAFNNQYPVSQVLIWRLDRPEATWDVFDYRYTARSYNLPLLDPLISHQLPITSQQADALAQWYDENENRRAIARGLGFASRLNGNNRAFTRRTCADLRRWDNEERPTTETIRSRLWSSQPPARLWNRKHNQLRYFDQPQPTEDRQPFEQRLGPECFLGLLPPVRLLATFLHFAD